MDDLRKTSEYSELLMCLLTIGATPSAGDRCLVLTVVRSNKTLHRIASTPCH